MKILTAIFCFLVSSVYAGTLELSSGRMDYEVKHLIKRVSGESDQIKGKMECGEEDCNFLIGANVKSFISSDSNRDLNMQTITEAGKFPVTSAKGKVLATIIRMKGDFEHAIEVEFHGIKKTYQSRTEVLSENKMVSKFILKLEDHGIERPSLFGVKIDNDVPMTLKMEWSKK